MKIIKRNGDSVSYNPNKIYQRIRKTSIGLKINEAEIFSKVILNIPTDTDISTVEIDNIVALIAAQYSATHQDYSKLAANVAISSFHKSTVDNFYEMMMNMNQDGIINSEMMAKIEAIGADKINKAIEHSRDYNFDYFAWKSLETTYLLRNSKGVIVERPQFMYMRVALWLTNTFEEAVEYYESLSKQLISPATPIMINSGTKNPQLASCVLVHNESDSREGLLNTLHDISVYSSDAAGIGLCLSNIRSKESKIATSGGNAGGLLKYLKIVNESLRFFNQQGRRPGAAGIYIEPWHKDVFDFLDIKKNTGAEELRARDLFLALWCPDNFFKAVKEDGYYYLFCPNDIEKAGLKPLYSIYGEEFENEYNKAVEMGLGVKTKALDIWRKICQSQIETGVPYLLAKDTVNRKSNQKNIGTISQSNLCLTEDTIVNIQYDNKLLKTDIKTVIDMLNDGIDIKILSFNTITNINEVKTVTNGALMNKSAKVMKITDNETGKSLKCTPEHKIYTLNRGYVEAKDLVTTDKLLIK